jgi:prophage DNA circulation protein
MAAAKKWQDRVRPAAYTAPSGVRIRFDFEDVGREYTKRGTVFEFPGVDGAYIQQTGFGPRRYPMRCFFWGSDHDQRATQFEAALLEDGTGRLEHPFYPTVTVVPFGDITRRDDLKSAANQSVIEVTFWTTVGAIYPQSQPHPQNEILSAVATFETSAANQFAGSTSLLKAVDKANGKAGLRGMLQGVSAALDGVSTGVLSVSNAFQDIVSDVNYGMDVLIGQPLLLAQQIQNLIKAPGRAWVGIQSRLDAYSALADSIFGSTPGSPGEVLATIGSALESTRTKVANDFHIADLFATSTVSAAVAAVTDDPVDASGAPVRGGNFQTKPQAIAAAAQVLELFEAVVTWRDSGFTALEGIDTVAGYQVDAGGSYQALREAVALATGNLVAVSFALAPERRVVLDRPRTLIDLSAELYGKIDNATLDLMIHSNDLTGSEILELPRGRSIAYFRN